MNNKMSTYRIIIMICGVLAILGFFFIPCYHNSLVSAAGLLGGLFGAEGAGTGLANISAFKMITIAIKNASELRSIGMESAIHPIGTTILFGVPALLAVLLVILAIIGKKAGAIGGIVCSSGMLVCYFIQVLSIPSIMKTGGYKVSLLYYILFIFAILTLVMAILDLKSAGKRYEGNGSGNIYGKNYEDTVYEPSYDSYGHSYDRPRRKEGVIVGIKGEYKGATLPAADGVRITIGRSAKDCNLVLTNPAVSRVHCYVTYYADRDVYGVTDVSKYGVYDVQGKLIERDRMVYMGVGDEIHIGKSNNAFRLE